MIKLQSISLITKNYESENTNFSALNTDNISPRRDNNAIYPKITFRGYKPTTEYQEQLKQLFQNKYDNLCKEMGFTTSPKLVYDKKFPFDTAHGQTGCKFDPIRAEITINPIILTPETKVLTKIKPQKLVKKELESAKQFINYARIKKPLPYGRNIFGLKKQLTQYCNNALIARIPMTNNQERLSMNMVNCGGPAFNLEFYETMLDEHGILDPKSKEAQKAQQFMKEYVASAKIQNKKY